MSARRQLLLALGMSIGFLAGASCAGRSEHKGAEAANAGASNGGSASGASGADETGAGAGGLQGGGTGGTVAAGGAGAGAAAGAPDGEGGTGLVGCVDGPCAGSSNGMSDGGGEVGGGGGISGWSGLPEQYGCVQANVTSCGSNTQEYCCPGMSLRNFDVLEQAGCGCQVPPSQVQQCMADAPDGGLLFGYPCCCE